VIPYRYEIEKKNSSSVLHKAMRAILILCDTDNTDFASMSMNNVISVGILLAPMARACLLISRIYRLFFKSVFMIL